ncbi:MAG: serine/threonine protein kinase [Acidobacteria bacterium]|nr:serine/threonine protein kinase [Acidobacteriota bacterium]
MESQEYEGRGTHLTAPGSTIGRYIVLHPVGSGAMGVVLAAYDPELDRKLAIKVLRPGPPGFEPGETEKKRLLREAQAMAALAHPNVVTIFDVGTVEDQVYIAMEYLESETTARWLEGKPSRQEILHVFQAAGSGLAAAHHAGLVHRDFKLDNVLVARDGRVKVTDFGLARPLPTDPNAFTAPAVRHPLPELDESPRSNSLLDHSLTAGDMIAGTPSYLAPECLKGQPATPLADQFSFCVALYRAMYGRYPFPRRQIMDLITQGHGPIEDPPPESRVPAWIRNILLRGLSDRPEDRFANMEELLAALSRDPARKRRRMLQAAGAALAAAAVLGGAVLMARRPAIRCERAAAAMESVWNGNVRQRLQHAFAATGSPLAGGSWRRVEEALNRYASSWRDMRVEACRATHVRGEQSEELLDLRMACLDNRLQEMNTLIEHLGSPDEKIVVQAPRAVLDLSGLASCADTAALTAPVPPPREPAIRDEVRQLQRRLAVARGARLVGNLEESITTVRAIVGQARELGYEPLLAESLTLQGQMEELGHNVDPARAHLEEALSAALASRHDAASVQALIGLIWLDGNDTFDFPRAHTWARLATAILQRLPRDQELSLDLANALGSTYQAEGRAQEALEQHRSALRLAEKLYGPDSYFAARSMGNLANVELIRGNFRGAAALLQRAVPLLHRHLGGSFNTALGENSLGAVLVELGRNGEARARYMKARNIFAQVLGADSIWMTITDLNLTLVDLEDGRYSRTLRNMEMIRKRFATTFPKEHPYSAYLDYGTGLALLGLGHAERALPLLQRAYELRMSSGTVNPYEVAQASFALARARWAVGQHPAALQLARKASTVLRGLPDGPMPFRDRVAAWLGQHEGRRKRDAAP